MGSSVVHPHQLQGVGGLQLLGLVGGSTVHVAGQDWALHLYRRHPDRGVFTRSAQLPLGGLLTPGLPSFFTSVGVAHYVLMLVLLAAGEARTG
jgi:hypothetical protein